MPAKYRDSYWDNAEQFTEIIELMSSSALGPSALHRAGSANFVEASEGYTGMTPSDSSRLAKIPSEVLQLPARSADSGINFERQSES